MYCLLCFSIKIENFTSKILFKISIILTKTTNLTGEQLKQYILIFFSINNINIKNLTPFSLFHNYLKITSKNTIKHKERDHSLCDKSLISHAIIH